MRIAITSPVTNPIGSLSDGGIQTFVAILEHELKRRGHTVDVYTTESSTVDSIKVPVVSKSAQEQNLSLIKTELFDIAGSVKTFDLINHAKEPYDIIHNNQRNFYSFWQSSKLKNSLTTLHISNHSYHLELDKYLTHNNVQTNFVAISEFMKRDIQLDFLQRIYNGLDYQNFPYQEKSGDYLAWVGRFSPKKGLKEAIDIAQTTHKELRFAASPFDYRHRKEILELVKGSSVKFLGQTNRQETSELFKGAKAFIFPLQWDEPFGYTLIEAMASGTPVIAYNRGAVSEIVIDGKTGFICEPNDVNSMEKAIHKIFDMPEDEYRLMRQACRKRVEDYFTAKKMVDEYEKLYHKIIQTNQGGR